MNETAYTDKTAVENYLLITIDDSFNDQIQEWIIAMSRYLDGVCNRVLYKASPETYLYDGDNTDILLIRDCCNITSITLNGDEQMPNVAQYPDNKVYTSRIKLKPVASSYPYHNYWRYGIQNIAVTGVQAMSDELLPDVKLACTILVASIVNYQIRKDIVGTTEKIGNYQITYATPDAEEEYKMLIKGMLSSYKRITM